MTYLCHLRLFTCLPLLTWLLLAGSVGAEPLPAELRTRLLRFPDIQGERIAFVYGGDIWTIGIGGGLATRITSHAGIELFPKFSPDGKWIAFTGQYDGDEQVYVVDSSGGIPRQLTFYPARGPLPDRWGADNQVYGWTPDGSAVLFRSMAQGWSLTDTRLFTVPIGGGLPMPLPMRVSGGGTFSPDGKKVVFSPLTRDFRTWKRYAGGWAQDLYVFNLADNSARQITDDPRSDRDPMWIGDRIYFSSDRSGTLNLYNYDLATNQTTAITQSTTTDVRWPSQDESQIVYELGGELRVLNTVDGKTTEVDVRVPTDGLAVRPRTMPVARFIEDVALSPGGERALFSARGDIFTVPIEHGAVRNLTRTSNAHDKHPAWSPDGKSIAFISDLDGEEELYLVDEKGHAPPRQITDGSSAMYFNPLWASDSKRVALTDKNGKLFVIDLDSKEKREVADDPWGRISDAMWSPCGHYLAFSMQDENEQSSIHIWSSVDGRTHRITDELFNEFEPVWDPDGKYLFYLAEREFVPQLSGGEWNYAQNRGTRIYALGLAKDTPMPFPPQSDEVNSKKEDGDQDAKESEKAKNEEERKEENKEQESDVSHPEKAEPLKVDLDGLAQRVAVFPVEPENIQGLNAIKGHLLYERYGASYYGREGETPTSLHRFSLKDREAEEVASGIDGYVVSQDGTQMLVISSGDYVRRSTTEKEDGKKVSLEELTATVDPRQEWRQTFGEVWRRFRDYFYVDNMHGYDWEALRKQYEPLVEHVAHRSDLNYVIGEMIGELNVGHAYKAGGDFERPKRPDVGLPGALFELDAAAQRYRIAKIFKGDNEEPRYRSPLTEPGVQISVGDYVLKIDGEDLPAGVSPYERLRYKSAHPVTFTVNGKPDLEGAREVTFTPVSSETDLIYLDYVLTNRERVLKASNGEFGYLHIPDMSEDGIREFNKWFYGQIRKRGLVIDVRSNGGGNVSQMIIERLNRKLLATGFARNSDFASTYPETVFTGHLVCLLDEDSASDGDIFPAMFRQAGLGPLIGKRSWGGVVGISGHGALIDGGQVSVPEFGFASTEGQWIIEGHGVDPDIVVENDPKSLIEGRDPQLERGIEELRKKLAEKPVGLPSRPAPPVKTK